MRSIEARVAGLVAIGTLLAVVVFAWVVGGLAEGYARRGLELRVETLAGELAAGLAVAADGTLEIVRAPEEPAFERGRSGWYWLARQGDKVIGLSRSFGGRDATALLGGEPVGPFDEPLVVRSRPLAAAPQVIVTIGGPAQSIAGEVRSIRLAVGWISAALGLALIIGTTLLIRYALRPLRGLTEAIEDVRAGRRDAVPATGIANLDPVAEAVNRLRGTLTRMAERSRQDAENLAHAIKTPLSVVRLRTDPGGPAEDAEAAAAAARIERQVDSHLRRTLGGSAGGFQRNAVAIDATIEDAILVASRAHGAGRIAVERSGMRGLAVDARREQLDEVIGVIVDNAFRHARGKVEIATARRGEKVEVTIADDGPGIPDAELALLPERGRRLDETADGHGLGLAIAHDIVADLGGTIRLANRAGPERGLVVVVELPAA
jgi:signal transduction histidine kinase